MELEELPSGSVFRHKSPTFRKSETLLLLKLIDKYKNPLLIKSTLHSVTYIKDKAWAELTKEFNMLSENTEFERTFDVLKTKWDNLKRLAKKCSRNGLDPTDESCDEIVKNVNVLCGAEVAPMEMIEPDSDDETESKDQKFNRSTFDTKHEIKEWNHKAADDSDGESEKKRNVLFSPRDCRLLLHCVRQEKNVLFANTPSGRKQKAWSRVAQAFNRQSPSKRAPRELKQKFQNLKYMASRINNSKNIFTKSKKKKYQQLNEDHKIKTEPKSDGTDDFDMDNDEGLDADGIDNSGSIHSDLNDPLSNGVTVDSGLGSSNHSENSEVDKLKLEILNYEMETAKLQRKRIEDAIAAEKSERESRAIVNALRIRAARLEVVTAESKLPSLHPALNYTPEETPGLQYLTYRGTQIVRDFGRLDFVVMMGDVTSPDKQGK